MPIYEYTCGKCNTKFERLIRTMAERGQKIACPECGSTRTERAFSVFAVGAESGGGSSPPPGPCGRQCGSGSCPMAG